MRLAIVLFTITSVLSRPPAATAQVAHPAPGAHIAHNTGRAASPQGRWVAEQERRAPGEFAWLDTYEVFAGRGWTAPGLSIWVLPEFAVGVLLNADPLGYRELGLGARRMTPFTFRARVGWTTGAWTLSVAGRVSRILVAQGGGASGVPYPGKPWNAGAELGLRYTLLFGQSAQPFVDAAVGAVSWKLPVVVSAGGVAESINQVITPLARVGLGLAIRLSHRFFFEGAIHFEIIAHGNPLTGSSLFQDDLMAVVPSIAFTQFWSSE